MAATGPRAYTARPCHGLGRRSGSHCASRVTTFLTVCSSAAKDDLLELIAGEERGLRSQKDATRRRRVIKAFEALAELGAGTETTSARALSDTWRMLWTTEKEQLFIIEKAPIFGTAAGDILQVIDVERARLQNVITFPPSGAFLVSSTLEIASDQRAHFRFTGAVLRGASWSLPIPPFGQGWFESLYVDDKIRLAVDVRGDYLVVERAPYKWEVQ